MTEKISVTDCADQTIALLDDFRRRNFVRAQDWVDKYLFEHILYDAVKSGNNHFMIVNSLMKTEQLDSDAVLSVLVNELQFEAYKNFKGHIVCYNICEWLDANSSEYFSFSEWASYENPE